ncbi:MAG: Trm112 family protein [SAR202 cluster bacterium]|nr:Trm112 family protein [SAR202 cluster bacterium]
MRKDLIEILACPVCRGKLELQVQEERSARVITGTLRCPACRHTYPIKDAIPNLLPPALRQP